jgi:hypothetical protein
MSMYRILLLTDQQLKRDASSIDDIETIDREYAALTEEDKTKYNALVKDMVRDKYSNAAALTAKKVPYLQQCSVAFFESLWSYVKFLTNAILTGLAKILTKENLSVALHEVVRTLVLTVLFILLFLVAIAVGMYMLAHC